MSAIQFRIPTACLLFLAVATTTPSLAEELPEHAVRVLGDDAYVVAADKARYINDDLILATSRFEAATVDAASGRVSMIEPLVDPTHKYHVPVATNGPWVGTASGDGQKSEIVIKNAERPNESSSFVIDGFPKCIAISEGGESIVVVTRTDPVIRVFRREDGKLLDELPAPADGSADISSVTFVGQGSFLAVTRRIKDRKGSRTTYYSFLTQGAFGFPVSSMDLDDTAWFRIIPVDSPNLVLLRRNTRVELYDFDREEITASVSLRVTCFDAALDPTGTTLITCGAYQLIHAWDITKPTPEPLLEIDAGSRVTAVNYSSDGKSIMAAAGGRISIWDAESGDRRNESDKQMTGSLSAVAVSPDGSRIAAADSQGRVQMWSLPEEELLVLPDKALPRTGGYDPWPTPQFLNFSANGKLLLGGSNRAHNVVNIWDAKSGVKVDQFGGHRWPIMGVAWSADGKRIASTSRDDTLKVRDARGEILHVFEQSAGAPAFFPKSNRIASGGKHGSGAVVKIYDLENEKLEKSLLAENEHDCVWSIAISPDGSRLAAAFGRGTIQLWDTKDWEVILSTKLDDRKNARGGSVAFSHDGRWLAAVSMTKDISLFDADNGTLKRKLKGHRDMVRGLAFSQQHLVSAGSDRRVIMWKLPAMEQDE